MHKHTFGLSHKKARRVTLFPQWFLWLYWQLGMVLPGTIARLSRRCKLAMRRVAAAGLVGSGRKKGEDPGCENELEPWKGMNMLFYPLHSLSCDSSVSSSFYYISSFSPQIRLKVLISVPFLRPTCILRSPQASLHSFFPLTLFPSLSVVFHCVLMRGTWRKRPPHLFVCLWESYFLSKGFWAADFLFSPDERQMFRIPRSISFSRLLGFFKIQWLKAAWDRSKNDIKAFYFQVSLYSRGHIKALCCTCTGVCMCTREQCLKHSASAW